MFVFRNRERIINYYFVETLHATSIIHSYSNSYASHTKTTSHRLIFIPFDLPFQCILYLRINAHYIDYDNK